MPLPPAESKRRGKGPCASASTPPPRLPLARPSEASAGERIAQMSAKRDTGDPGTGLSATMVIPVSG